MLLYELLGQWRRIKTPKIDPNIYQNLVYNKYNILKLWRKHENSVSISGTIVRHRENSELNPHSFLYPKINTRGLMT